MFYEVKSPSEFYEAVVMDKKCYYVAGDYEVVWVPHQGYYVQYGEQIVWSWRPLNLRDRELPIWKFIQEVCLLEE